MSFDLLFMKDMFVLPIVSSSTLFLFLASLALYSTTEYPNYAAINLAVVVFPNPASPLNNAALEFIVPEGMKELKVGFTSLLFPLIWTSSQICNHYFNSFSWEDWLMIYYELLGLYFYVQGIEILSIRCPLFNCCISSLIII